MKALLAALAIVAALAAPAAARRLHSLQIGADEYLPPTSTGFVMQVDGVSYILLSDGVSKLKRVK
jgi:hypothetical protein